MFAVGTHGSRILEGSPEKVHASRVYLREEKVQASRVYLRFPVESKIQYP